MSIKVFGTHDDATLAQLQRCVEAVPGARGVECADGHLGYSMPIGGVVAYPQHVSPSGVGYDIACGNMAVKTDIMAAWYEPHQYEQIANEIQRRISFGIGRNNDEPVDHPVLDKIRSALVMPQRTMVQLATNQLGTVGSGNHYVDVLEDGHGWLWVAVHFGSRGFGHKTASMFMNAAQGLPMTDKSHDGEMNSPPLLLDVTTDLGDAYIHAMTLAGDYAYAGRELVVAKVLEIMGATATETVHNHHNFAWKETHDGQDYWVVRKGATPLFPGQLGFVGGSMGDISVVLEGQESSISRNALYSAPHGAGRVMSRNAAVKGKYVWMCAGAHPQVVCYTPPQQAPKDLKCPVCGESLLKWQTAAPIDFMSVQDRIKGQGIVLRGAGPDESPEVYRPLGSVLREHAGTFNLVHEFRPRIVVMAGKDVKDPYKD